VEASNKRGSDPSKPRREPKIEKGKGKSTDPRSRPAPVDRRPAAGPPRRDERTARPAAPQPEQPRYGRRGESSRPPVQHSTAPPLSRPSAPRVPHDNEIEEDFNSSTMLDPLEVVWGRRTVLEFLRSGAAINRLYVLTTGEGLPREFFEMAKERQIPVVRSPRDRLDGMTHSGNHQGVVAQVGARDFVAWDDLLGKARAKDEPLFLLALDGIQDPGNFGALLRTAEGSGAQGVAITSKRSCGLTAAVSKASAGADAYLPVARLDRLDKALADLVQSGVQVVATLPNADLSPYDVDFTKPTVLVLGSEGLGVDPRIARVCSHRVRLPMRGKVESLNVSACGAVMLYEVLRQRSSARSERIEG
jgi:23S rRNA (guanosine2251-2'-O)-methyltransferase